MSCALSVDLLISFPHALSKQITLLVGLHVAVDIVAFLRGSNLGFILLGGDRTQ